MASDKSIAGEAHDDRGRAFFWDLMVKESADSARVYMKRNPTHGKTIEPPKTVKEKKKRVETNNGGQIQRPHSARCTETLEHCKWETKVDAAATGTRHEQGCG